MKINSEKLFDYVNNLGTNEKVKFKVYYDDSYITEIYWDGENFNWESGSFSSGAFFNPLYDFEEIEEDKGIESLPYRDNSNRNKQDVYYELVNDIFYKVNELVKEVNKLKNK